MTIPNLDTSKFDPRNHICEYEFKALFLRFCTLVCILHNKKLNLANIFLLVLKEEKIKQLYMDICEFDCEYEALRTFLEYDNSLHKSKYIKKYLNARNGTPKKRGTKKRASKK
jgi:hypothetical protein